MAQKIDIGDYVNLNLDQNDMATALNNLNNPNGSQVIDDLMEQYEGMQQQPQIMQQQQMQQQQMQQPIIQQPIMQQPIMTNLYNNTNDEKNKILKDLDLSEKQPQADSTVADAETNKKSLMLHIKETVLVVLLYIMLGNDYINVYITKYVPYFNESPLVLFIIKVILMGLLYHAIRYFMNR
jgi:hypothetical protein